MPDKRNETSDPTIAVPKATIEYSSSRAPSRMHRATAATRRWARDTFSREQLIAALKQLAWVAPLTVLIWVYAEREQRTTDADVRFGVEVHTNNPKVFVRLLEPNDGYASADLTGARSQLDKLRRELGGSANAVRFEVPADRKDGEHQFPLTFVVGRDPRFAGVTPGNAMPRNITVLVDTLVEENVQVKVREGDQKLFEQALFNPSTVKVRMPKTVRDTILRNSRESQLVAYADLTAVTDRTPGRRLDLSGVPVTLANVPQGQEDGISLLPATVSVSLTVRRADREVTVPQLAVQELGVTYLRNRWKVEKEQDSLQEVVLVGPAEAIEALEKNPKQIYRYVEAFVKLEDGDDTGEPRPKEVYFRLPPGVRVKSADGKAVADDQPPMLNVTVTAKDPRETQ